MPIHDRVVDGDFVGRALWRFREEIANASHDLRFLYQHLWKLTGQPSPDLPVTDYYTLSAALLAFRPDLILELGRGIGNSTSLFQYWKNTSLQLRDTRILSICRTDHWEHETRPSLEEYFGRGWGADVHAFTGELSAQDYQYLTNAYGRVLVFWDAHGQEVADIVLTSVMPAVDEKPHIVIAHDMRDARYFGDEFRSYGQKSLWRSQDDSDSDWVFLGELFSSFDQAVAIVDFCSRNRISLYSASHSINGLFRSDPQREDELRHTLPDFDAISYWYYFCIDRSKIAAPTYPISRVIRP